MKHILVVDDSKTIHAYLTAILEPEGIQLTHAYDGLEGFLALEKSNGGGFDAVLLDWEMPKLNGLETLKRIRSAGFKVPVLMATTKNNPNDIVTAIQAGATEYIMKPFVSDVVLAKLNEFLIKAA